MNIPQKTAFALKNTFLKQILKEIQEVITIHKTIRYHTKLRSWVTQDDTTTHKKDINNDANCFWRKYKRRLLPIKKYIQGIKQNKVERNTREDCYL